MGLNWERAERRKGIKAAVTILERAVMAAMGDAESEYDARDMATLLQFLITVQELEVPETEGPKAGDG